MSSAQLVSVFASCVWTNYIRRAWKKRMTIIRKNGATIKIALTTAFS
jgi:hypothetical protein